MIIDLALFKLDTLVDFGLTNFSASLAISCSSLDRTADTFPAEFVFNHPLNPLSDNSVGVILGSIEFCISFLDGINCFLSIPHVIVPAMIQVFSSSLVANLPLLHIALTSAHAAQVIHPANAPLAVAHNADLPSHNAALVPHAAIPHNGAVSAASATNSQTHSHALPAVDCSNLLHPTCLIMFALFSTLLGFSPALLNHSWSSNLLTSSAQNVSIANCFTFFANLVSLSFSHT